MHPESSKRRYSPHQPRSLRPCPICGQPYWVRACDLRKGERLYCSRACADKRNGTLREAFWRQVQSGAGCWLWKGGTVTGGYGIVHREHRTVLAHRLSWELHHGPVPDELDVLHRCDTPPCVNPAHLFLGTHQDNMEDRGAKGRTVVLRGEAQGGAKLTDAAVRDIRNRYAARETGVTSLAREYGVGLSSVYRVVRGETWRHVT